MSRLLLSAAIAASVLGSSALAATCADRTKVVQNLEQRFGETLYANAVSKSANVLEVFASPDAETWSITVFLPERGLSCLAAAGKGKHKLELALMSR